MNNLVIGITGGIGSGKSTVSNILIDNGYKVILADNIAKNVMNSDSQISNKIINIFGHDCYSNGKLNSKVLAEIVFNHPDKINRLNSIVHPPTIKKIKEEINELQQIHKIVFVEAALIFEAKMVDLFDHILLVTADTDTRIRRVLDRDNVTASELKGRILAQIPEDQKRGRSDFTIDNETDLESLKQKTLFFLNLFNNLVDSH